MKTYQVFLGTNKPTGGVVTTYEWSQFLKQIDATFTEGYTVQKAIGRWNGVNEDTFLLTVITEELKTLTSLCQTYKDLLDTNRFPDRSLVTDKESILYYELLEESRYQVEITLFKKFLSFFQCLLFS